MTFGDEANEDRLTVNGRSKDLGEFPCAINTNLDNC